MNIKEICKLYNIENYKINPDESIDVDGNVILFNRRLTKLPLKFNKVTGDFSCTSNLLTNLEGCPNYVGGNFNCHLNQLPEEIRNNPKAEILRLQRESKLNILLDEY